MGQVFARGLFWGSACLMGCTSLISALSGNGLLWVTPLFAGAQAWNLVSGLMWLLIAWHVLRPRGRRIRLALLFAILLTCASSLMDSYGYFQLVNSGAIQTPRALPASLVVLLLGLAGAWSLKHKSGAPSGALARLIGLTGAGCGALALLLVLLLTFGASDYRRNADCAVILGAGVRADGTPSLSLSDRVAEGVRLYHEQHVRYLVMSGGVDPNHGRSEAQVMCRLAARAGVPREHIVLDERGVNTRASASNCALLMRKRGWNSALLVSHGYHLLRARGAFQRAGALVYTVPATESRRLAREPYFVFRECVAWLAYALPS